MKKKIYKVIIGQMITCVGEGGEVFRREDGVSSDVYRWLKLTGPQPLTLKRPGRALPSHWLLPFRFFL